MGNDKQKVDKFDGSDYGFWWMQIEDFLYGKDLYKPLKGVKPEGDKKEDWEVLDRKTMGVLRSTLVKSIAKKTKKMKTTKEIIDFLSDKYEKPSAVGKVDMVRKLFNLKMAEGASISDHIDDHQDILDSLSAVEITFDDEVQALILLGSLPGSWSGTVTALSASAGKNKLKSEDVKDLLISEENRNKKLGVASTSGAALATNSRGKSGTNRNWKSESGKNVVGGGSKSKEKSKGNQDPIKCYKCGEIEHFKRDCPNRGNNSANVVTEDIVYALVLSVSWAAG